ncbi:hypothetical protein [Sphingobacterium sp. xlx-130]|uniref:hypothetical protein n=1 Tax=Sphingobacterium sp. xlx-130 TaxID=2654323 RepID=UPI0013DA62F7|nr:hypothetical protein [Sphingobacterium sp. xlx-130]
MSIILQAIGSLILVLNQVFRSRKSLILEYKKTLPLSNDLGVSQAIQILKRQVMNILGFLYIVIGYLIQLFNFDKIINDFLCLDKIYPKILTVSTSLIVPFITSIVLAKIFYKSIISTDKKGFKGVMTMTYNPNAPSGKLEDKIDNNYVYDESENKK